MFLNTGQYVTLKVTQLSLLDMFSLFKRVSLDCLLAVRISLRTNSHCSLTVAIFLNFHNKRQKNILRTNSVMAQCLTIQNAFLKMVRVTEEK